MIKWLITCEHAGNDLPEWIIDAFCGHEDILSTHWAIDAGAIDVFGVLKERLAHHALLNTMCRLVIDFNRDLRHPDLFSRFSATIPNVLKDTLLNDFYLSYVHSMQQFVKEEQSKGNIVVHISVHSFTPQLDGVVRKSDIGLLFDPQRPQEQLFVDVCFKRLSQVFPHFMLTPNYPFLGYTGGQTTVCRRMFFNDYLGIELEINQKHEKNMFDIAQELVPCFIEAATFL